MTCHPTNVVHSSSLARSEPSKLRLPQQDASQEAMSRAVEPAPQGARAHSTRKSSHAGLKSTAEREADPMHYIALEHDNSQRWPLADRYVYQSLSDGDYIRRLILEPGVDDDALVARLEGIDLSQAHGSFEAISYAWGPNAQDQAITIDQAQMKITASLRDSLRQVRQPDKARALWVDAICINQDDDREKGRQVELMGRIYKTSRCTLICLGYSNTSWPRQVAALIAEIEEMMKQVFRDLGLSMDWDSFPRPAADHPLLADERWKSWAELITQPWFHRGWVVQEAALGRQCRVLWAGVDIPWIGILRVGNWLNMRAHHLIHKSTSRRLSNLHSWTYALKRPDEARTLVIRPREGQSITGPAVTTIKALDHARELELTNPKDRVYAFMAYPTSDAAMLACAIQPNYGQDTTHLDVYWEFAAKYLVHTLDLDVLCFVEQDEDVVTPAAAHSHLEQMRCHSFPSWVPRWDRGAGVAPIWARKYRKIDSPSQKMALLENGLILQVKAVIFDSVKCVSEVIKAATQSDEAVVSVVSQWRTMAKQSKSFPVLHQSRLGSAFLDALSVGRYVGHQQVWNQALKAFAELLQSDSPNFPMSRYKNDRNAQFASSPALNNVRRRRLIVLGRGLYGASSAATREGDVCAVIFGTRAPLILREVAGRRDQYAVVGVAYVQSAVLSDDEIPIRMGENEACDDWKYWNLPEKNIFLC